MVEGHQCHRVAHAHRRTLLGHRFKAISPNQRFVEGAAAISGKVLSRIEVHGKQLFYFFGDDHDPVVMQIHFGMSGAFRTMAAANARETRETTRLVLEDSSSGLLAHLSAMTVQHGNLDFYHKMSSKLGPDPLRLDADSEKLWTKMQTSRKPVGLILMDQSAVAGIGNIFRAEILFKAGVHPEQPCNTIDRPTFERIWHHCVTLLQRGFQSGSILTVDPDEAARLGKPWTRRYVYNHSACGRCGAKIATWDMATRTVYACETCQPLEAGTVLPSQRLAALAAAQPTKEFKSHCAPEETLAPHQLTILELKHRLAALGVAAAKHARKPHLVQQLEATLASRVDAGAVESAEGHSPEGEAVGAQPAAEGPAAVEGAVVVKRETAGASADEPQELQKLTVTQLKAQLRTLGQPQQGRKADLVARLAAASAAQQSPDMDAAADVPAGSGATAIAHVASPADGEGASGQVVELAVNASAAGAEGTMPVAGAAVPGTAQLGEVASAEAAAEEKAAAGEGRNVEHVALHVEQRPDDSKPSRQGKRSRRQAGLQASSETDVESLHVSKADAKQGGRKTSSRRAVKKSRQT